ncbi:unnamed protein product [Nezara viridula]|uniref:SCP domain-containing protein n=1 Tax=Nezara viridula TaxID=85310 RepID=A0A9P0HSN0_NEZVI|nr:unnamed protein product [Nezara viridula]
MILVLFCFQINFSVTFLKKIIFKIFVMIFVAQILFLLIHLSPSEQTPELIQSTPFSCKEIRAVLHFHNKKRNDIAFGKTKLKGGKNIWQLKWDEKLADVAYKYVQRCEIEHNNNRPNDTGENIAWRKSANEIQKPVSDMTEMMEEWYNEIEVYEENGKDNQSSSNFTQMIWAATKFVGCGFVYYVERTEYPLSPYCQMLICNYRPSGNVAGEDMYTKHDEAIEKCDIGVPSWEFEALCAHDAKHARTKDFCLGDFDSEVNNPFTCEEIVASLKYHNEVRNNVSLGKTILNPAKNMWQLKWDKKLEEMAQNFVKKCEFKHNDNRPIDAGENLAMKAFPNSLKSLDPVEMMDMWYTEYYNYGRKNGTTAHFTQLIWGSTKFVGCGIAHFLDKAGNPSYPYHTMLVCNYRPAGNLAGAHMYDKFLNGSKSCDVGVSSQLYKGLCGGVG